MSGHNCLGRINLRVHTLAIPVPSAVGFCLIAPVEWCTDTGTEFIPRWVRVNTLKYTTAQFLQKLASLSLTQVPDLPTLQTTPQGYLLDLHIPDLLAFHRSYPLTTTSFAAEYTSGQIILQDKASCIPACLLAVQPGDMVLDACAAPGNKTTQLAAAVGPGGRVIAVERDRERVVTLRNMVEKAGAAECTPPKKPPPRIS
jgi:25S rRNA (cytosine2278-C5)-methyltransferase